MSKKFTGLCWISTDATQGAEALLGTPNDGVLFSWQCYPTCYRRGPYRLLIEVCGGIHHFDWGCLDSDDQPMRYYHSKECMLQEANAIAAVLWADRQKVGKVKTDNESGVDTTGQPWEACGGET